MRVGIMSMQRIDNYGSFLQAYSLRQMLEELGHEVFFVDYKIEPCIVQEKNQVKVCPKHSITYRIARRMYYVIKNIVRNINGQKKAEEDFEAGRLRNMYVEYVKELGVTEERTENVPVDVLVIGSDEVFNCLQTNKAVGYSKQLFGEGVNADRVITYAACAGFTTIEGLKKYGILDEVSNMMKKNFNRISVRDNNTYQLVYELTGEYPFMHLDPVLIADFQEKIIDPGVVENYVVVYSYEERMSNNPEERDSIQKFAHQRGLKTVSIGNYQSWTDMHISASPFELLGYVKKADYVVTDTFHGTVFSIVLEKQFVTLVRDSNKQKLESLLQQFKLEKRIVQSLESLEDTLIEHIDFTYANQVRKLERKNSLSYLKQEIDKLGKI